MAIPLWLIRTQQASWRGVPFICDSIQKRGGRKIALHEYLYVDIPWVEDLGKGIEEFQIEGRLVGDNIVEQLTNMDLMCDNQSGPGDLVHTIKGSIKVTLVAYANHMDVVGNKVDLRFTFVSQAENIKIAPFSDPFTQALSRIAAIEVMASSSLALFYIQQATALATYAARAIETGSYLALLGIVSEFGGGLIGLTADATAAVNAVSGLSSILTGGNYTLSRYNYGHTNATNPALADIATGVGTASQSVFASSNVNNPTLSAATPSSTALTVTQQVTLGTTALLSAAAQARTNVATAVSATHSAAQNFILTDQSSSSNLVNATYNSTEQLRLACARPTDAIRLIIQLCTFQAYVAPQSTIDATVPVRPTLPQAIACVCRRAALATLANATADYIPTSSDDVTTIINQITPLYDAEINLAGDIGDDQVFQKLIDLKAAVIKDLQIRGASLPQLISISRNTSLPSFVIAEQQYGDGSRSNELVQRVNPRNPLFMPLKMTVLNS